jgi:hypothetical protein
VVSNIRTLKTIYNRIYSKVQRFRIFREIRQAHQKGT